MKSTKRNRITYAGLGQIPVTERPAPTHEIPETREQANARIRQEVFDSSPEQVSARAFQKLQDEATQLMRELHVERQATAFTQESPELIERTTRPDPASEDTPTQKYEKTLAAARKGCPGLILTDEGKAKLFTLGKLNNIDLTRAENWQAILGYGLEIGVLLPEEGFPGPKQAPVRQAPVHEPTSSEIIDGTLSTTREQEAALKRVVGGMWSTEFAKMFGGWIVSLRNNFNYDFPIDQLGAKAARYLDQHNLSPFAYKSYDLIRVNFVRTGLFPDHMMTASERLADFIENSDMSDRETRQKVALWQRDILENGPPLPLHK